MSLCEECDKSDVFRCGGCQSSLYCSKKCQKKGWPTHKHLCKALKDFQDRPTTNGQVNGYTRAIYFHPDEKVPRFLWLPIASFRGDISSDSTVVIHQGTLLANTDQEAKSDDQALMKEARVDHNYALGRQSTHTIFVGYRDTFLIDDSKPNKAIHATCDHQSRYLHDWKGPMIAYGTNLITTGHLDPHSSVDLAPADIRLISHWLNTFYAQGSLQETKRMLSECEGVRINCGGDVEHGGRPKYEPVTVPAYHRIFEEQVAPVSALINLPVTMQRIPGNLNRWNNGTQAHGMSAYCNQAATYLYIGCDPNATDITAGPVWGFAPMEWQNKVGSVVVVRQDKKPLLPEHAEALSDYCQFHLTDLFQRQTDGEVGMDEARILSEISEEKFRVYYETWKESQEEEKKRTQISPYEV